MKSSGNEGSGKGLRMYKIDACPREDLTYIMIYAPPGLEQHLKSQAGYGSSSVKS